MLAVRSRHPALLIASVLAAVVALLAAIAALPAEARGGPPPGVPAGPPAGLPSSAPHEVWALDQGTDLIHVIDERGNEVAEIDVTPGALDAVNPDHGLGDDTVAHMIDFDSEYRYAFVAGTRGVTIVIDAPAREVVAVLPTGPGSHMAAVTPDDSAVWVAAIGAQRMVEIPLDLDADEPTFEIGRELDVEEGLGPLEDANGWDFPSYGPVCHQYSPDSSEAWVTLGPAHDQGGLFVLDLDAGTITAAWDPSDVRANCGVAFDHDGTRVIANWSGTLDAEHGDTEGEWYVFDAQAKQLIHRDSSRGFDAHGVRFSPDGRQLWMVNRITDNALIIDARTFRVQREIADIAKTPDILDFSPDGRLVYLSQRGPKPITGGTHAATGPQPGVAVVHRASARTLRVWEPPVALDEEGVVINDIHGLGVRSLG